MSQQFLHERRVSRVGDEIGPVVVSGGGDPDDVSAAEGMGGDGGIAGGARVLLARLDAGGNVFEDRLHPAARRQIELPVFSYGDHVQAAVFDASKRLQIFALHGVGLEVEAEGLLIGAEAHPLDQ